MRHDYQLARPEILRDVDVLAAFSQLVKVTDESILTDILPREIRTTAAFGVAAATSAARNQSSSVAIEGNDAPCPARPPWRAVSGSVRSWFSRPRPCEHIGVGQKSNCRQFRWTGLPGVRSNAGAPLPDNAVSNGGRWLTATTGAVVAEDDRIDTGLVFDQTISSAGTASGCGAMADDLALQVLIRT